MTGKTTSIGKFLGLTVGATLLLAGHSSAFAQVSSWTITYAPVASIPALSEWAMLALVVAMAALAVYTFRNKANAKPLASVILVSALTLGAFTGNKIMGDASATPIPTVIELSNPNGATITPDITFGRDNQVTNTSGVVLRIVSVSPASDPTGSSPTCAAATVLQPGASCWVVTGGA